LRAFLYIWGLFGGAKIAPKQHKKHVIWLFWTIWALPNEPKKKQKLASGQVGKVYGPMFKLKNKPNILGKIV
jgi:hypothetical protein